jgi:ribulose-phosphate 3-epimerase
MIEIIPALLAHSAEEFESRLRAIEHTAPRAQIDILDGTWKPELSWADPMIITNILSPVDYELHLMVAHPLEHLARWEEIPAVKSVFFHVECVDHPKAVIESIRFHGWEAGIAIAPGTSFESVAEIIPYCDDVLFLTVEPGASGRPFVSSVLAKIKMCRAQFPQTPISVDGALNATTIPLCKLAGATRFIVNSGLFGTEASPAEMYKKFCAL